MTEAEYVARIANLSGIRLPDPGAERHIKYMYELRMPVAQAVENLKRYLAIPT